MSSQNCISIYDVVVFCSPDSAPAEVLMGCALEVLSTLPSWSIIVAFAILWYEYQIGRGAVFCFMPIGVTTPENYKCILSVKRDLQ